MIEFIKDVWRFFVPARIDPLDVIEVEDMDRLRKINDIFDTAHWWRVKVSMSLFALVTIAIWSVSPWGFVQAADFGRKAEDSIKQLKVDVQETKVEVASIKKSNDAIKTAVDELISQKVSTDICRLVVRIKTEPDADERSIMRLEADSHQRRYRSLTGEYYPEDRCR